MRHIILPIFNFLLKIFHFSATRIFNFEQKRDLLKSKSLIESVSKDEEKIVQIGQAERRSCTQQVQREPKLVQSEAFGAVFFHLF